MMKAGRPRLYEIGQKCSVNECDNLHIAKGYCQTHYLRMKKHGTTEKHIRRCSVEGCDRKHSSKGYCAKHYRRNVQHGTTVAADHYYRESPNYMSTVEAEKYIGIDVAGLWRKRKKKGWKHGIKSGSRVYLTMEYVEQLKAETRPKREPYCTVDGCDKKHCSLGYCLMHYTRLKNTGKLTKTIRACTVDGCDRKYRTNGYCMHHLNRVLAHGDPHTVLNRLGQPLIKDVICDVDGCNNKAVSKGHCYKH